MIFFIDRGKIVWKDRKSTLEVSILHPQRIKRTLYGFLHFGYENLPGGPARMNQLQIPAHVQGFLVENGDFLEILEMNCYSAPSVSDVSIARRLFLNTNVFYDHKTPISSLEMMLRHAEVVALRIREFARN